MKIFYIRITIYFRYFIVAIASKTLSNCRQVFVNSYDQCVHKLHWSISWLCYVVRLTFICNFFSRKYEI